MQQSLRLSPEVIEHFKAGGAGWQRRIDEVLMRHVREAEGGGGVAEDRSVYRPEGGGKGGRGR